MQDKFYRDQNIGKQIEGAYILQICQCIVVFLVSKIILLIPSNGCISRPAIGCSSFSNILSQS